MIKKIASAMIALGGSLAVLFAPQASASDHYGPKVTVDLRQLPKGDCWYEVDRHGVEPICAPKPAKPKGDCALVSPSDYAVCADVRRQRAFGWTDDAGHPQNWVTNGRALVHDITHGGNTKEEMHYALEQARNDYRWFVTRVTFNVDDIARVCGNPWGAGTVNQVKGRDGHAYTWKHIECG